MIVSQLSNDGMVIVVLALESDTNNIAGRSDMRYLGRLCMRSREYEEDLIASASKKLDILLERTITSTGRRVGNY